MSGNKHTLEPSPSAESATNKKLREVVNTMAGKKEVAQELLAYAGIGAGAGADADAEENGTDDGAAGMD